MVVAVSLETSADFVDERPCPCGSGSYCAEEWVSDWGGSRERWTMLCPTCREQYTIFSFAYREKTSSWIGYRWVTRQEDEIHTALAQEVSAAADELLAEARTRHLERWMSLCRNRTKKQLWELLNDPRDAASPALSTFYKHARRLGLERHWGHEFSVPNMRQILDVLGVDDAELALAVGRLAELQRDLATMEAALRTSGFS
jgi:hypothetical protein